MEVSEQSVQMPQITEGGAKQGRDILIQLIDLEVILTFDFFLSFRIVFFLL